MIKLYMRKIKYIDLFCGIGSFHYSFEKLGWQCVMACDINETVRKTYENIYKLKPLGDITEIKPSDIGKYDILCAGFPCQPFSLAGQHKGFDDKRGTMFSHVMRFVTYHKPKVIILENVSALLSHDGGNSFAKINKDITEQGYTTTHKILKCSDYGIPQMRKRLFIIGIRNDKCDDKISKMFELNKYEKHVSLSKYLCKNFEKDVAYTIRCGGKNSPIDDKHNWDGYIVDGEEYRLTLDDAMKLQGFENIQLLGSIKEKWHMLGNTIPTIFTRIIGEQINKLFFKPDM